MYGLPKTHKDNVPLRPILSMCGSAQHNLAKWLNTVIEPVRSLYTHHCVRDSFTFVEELKRAKLNLSNLFLSSFDVKSLFTNVPLSETFEICADALYDGTLEPPKLPREIFLELLQTATSSVEFSFNDTMFRQCNGISMGSPLGPSLADIFVGYHEKKLFENVAKPLLYFRYVDDTFVAFKNERECNNFFEKLNCLHPALQFTVEKETDAALPFLDVLVERSGQTFLTSVYRKPTFTGHYIRWDSFCPKRRKLNLISSLVNRALRLCSPEKLSRELDDIHLILSKNGYPDHILKCSISRVLKKSDTAPKYGPEKCPAFLHLPWLGNVSNRFEKLIKSVAHRCYYSVNAHVVYTTKPLLPNFRKDVLPALNASNVVYEFKCHCDSKYVGRTSQRLFERITQHIPKLIRSKTCANDRTEFARQCKSAAKTDCYDEYRAYASAIGQHLSENPSCAQNYNDQMFTVIARGRSLFHLKALESTIIQLTKPILCRQKDFLYNLQISH